MKQKLLALVPATVIGGLCSYLGALVAPIILVVIMMLIDYATGIASAWVSGELSSRTGIIGILKKLGMICMIAVGGAVDFVIARGVAQVGYSIGTTYTFGLIICIWIIINECISVLENLAEIGVPVPEFLLKIIRRLKEVTERSAGEDKENDKDMDDKDMDKEDK